MALCWSCNFFSVVDEVTRHNVGFDMIDMFAQSQGISLIVLHFKQMFGEGMVDGVPVLVAKPQTYMNLSGESIFTVKQSPAPSAKLYH
ncbi:hypothetical protein GUJ93_ZPchr0004g39049 [Zizania palustris]|uniref:Uncharacterized protein n=1 Tax=Zizania palustris TaxID=103762 RepID=A0A8J5SFV9_ZIZPA|nr:hypothetical protein GUJ93_ZPchr0004g39049 [Zizania palustris]